MFFNNDRVDTAVYTVSKAPCDDMEALDALNRESINVVHKLGLNNTTATTTTYRDGLVATMTGFMGTPSFDNLEEAEKAIEAVHQKVAGYSETKGHMWVVREDKRDDYEQYVNNKYPNIMESKPYYRHHLQEVRGSVARLVDRDICRTTLFNYPLNFEDMDEETTLSRYLRETVDEDWPIAIGVTEVKII